MALKPDGQPVGIKEQIIEDRVSGLTLLFERLCDGTTRLVLSGACLPFGNREIIFDANGEEAGGGAAIGACRPSWLREVR